jgi:hypothetical protein
LNPIIPTVFHRSGEIKKEENKKPRIDRNKINYASIPSLGFSIKELLFVFLEVVFLLRLDKHIEALLPQSSLKIKIALD